MYTQTHTNIVMFYIDMETILIDFNLKYVTGAFFFFPTKCGFLTV